jgi:hypothetical protein
MAKALAGAMNLEVQIREGRNRGSYYEIKGLKAEGVPDGAVKKWAEEKLLRHRDHRTTGRMLRLYIKDSSVTFRGKDYYIDVRQVSIRLIRPRSKK